MLPETRQRAKAAMTELMGLSRPERARLLEADFPDDSAFRDEMLSLLDVCDVVAAQSRLSSIEKKAGDVPDASRGAAHQSMGELLKVGAVYGPYRVVEQLGVGGMGQVVLAEDVRLGRLVALKSLTGKWLQSPTARERLMREARAVAALVHPNIAMLYDVFEAEDRLLLVMEYVDGKTLASLIQEGPIAVGHALRLAGQVADAVSFAHDRGIIHCDLKPANIQESTEHMAKVLDFGLARLRYTQADVDDRVTTAGALLGTPGYVAPERLMKGVLNASGDIYSLGVVLFELVTGRRLLEGEDPEQWFEIISAGPPKPSSLVAGVPAVLDGVIERALSIDPAQRYQSARELSRDLQAILLSLDASSSAPVPANAGGRRADSAQPLAATPGARPSDVDKLQRRTKERTALQKVELVVLATAVAIVATEVFGLIASRAFEVILGIAPDFAAGPVQYFSVGAHALLPFVLYWLAGAAVLGVLAGLRPLFSSPLKILPKRWTDRTTSLDPATLATAAFLAGVAGWLTITWVCWGLFTGLDTLHATAGSGDLSVLSSAAHSLHRAHAGYSAYLSFLLGLAAWQWFPSMEKRADDASRVRVLKWATVVVAFMVVAMAVAPRRLIWDKFEVVTFESHPAFVIGSSNEELLLYSLQGDTRKQWRVRKDAATLRRTGTSAQIFDPQ